MAPKPETRVWRTIIRVTYAVAALAGVAVALIPSVRLVAVVVATLLAGAGAFAFMIWSAKKNGVSLRRPTKIKQTPAAIAVILVVACAYGGLVGLSSTLVLVLDAPYGLAIPMGVALGGIGAEMLDWLALRLASRSSKGRAPGSPTAERG
jgi:uncharacterized iron-regulated membrane protein